MTTCWLWDKKQKMSLEFTYNKDIFHINSGLLNMLKTLTPVREAYIIIPKYFQYFYIIVNMSTVSFSFVVMWLCCISCTSSCFKSTCSKLERKVNWASVDLNDSNPKRAQLMEFSSWCRPQSIYTTDNFTLFTPQKKLQHESKEYKINNRQNLLLGEPHRWSSHLQFLLRCCFWQLLLLTRMNNPRQFSFACLVLVSVLAHAGAPALRAVFTWQ